METAQIGSQFSWTVLLWQISHFTTDAILMPNICWITVEWKTAFEGGKNGNRQSVRCSKRTQRYSYGSCCFPVTIVDDSSAIRRAMDWAVACDREEKRAHRLLMLGWMSVKIERISQMQHSRPSIVSWPIIEFKSVVRLTSKYVLNFNQLFRCYMWVLNIKIHVSTSFLQVTFEHIR